jgi:Coenzyme PQQ synthesis protein D (PqqD)
MTATTLDAAFRIPDDVIFRELDGEAVVLNLDTGIYFGLDAVGTRIWRLIEERKALKAVLDTLIDEYDAPPDHLQRDLLAFVERLNTKGLLSRA